MGSLTVNLLIRNGIVHSEIDRFNCMLCESDTSLKNCVKHIESPSHLKHLQWFRLIFKTSGNNVKCEICNTIVAWGHLKSHAKAHIIVPWSEPDDNYDKYKIFFDNLIIQWQNLFNCCLCDDSFPNWEFALIHITYPKHQSLIKEKTPPADDILSKTTATWEFLVCEGLVAFNATALQCHICDYKNVSLSSVKRHCKGLLHLSQKSEFQVKLKDSRNSDSVATILTEISEITSLDCQEFEAVFSGNELKGINVAEEDENIASTKELKVINVAAEDQAISSTKELKFKNVAEKCEIMSSTKDPKDKNFAEEVDAIFATEEPYNVAKQAEVVFSKKDINITDVAEQLEVADCKRDFAFQNNFEERTSCVNYILKKNDSISYCVICNCHLISHEISNHTTNIDHIRSLEQYGCDAISMRSAGYYCEYCNCTISSIGNVYQHVMGKKHVNSMKYNDNQGVKATAVNATVVKKPKEHWELPARQYWHCSYIVRLSEHEAICTVCDCIISLSAKNQEIHVAGKCHEKSLKKHGCEKITFRGDNMYYCGYCDVVIYHLENIYVHIKEASHMNSLTVADKRQLQNARNVVSKVKASRDDSNGLKISSPSMPDNHVTLKAGSSYCEIREIETPNESQQIKKHAEGNDHLNSLKKYRCDKISLRGNRFYCACCKCYIDCSESVHKHLKKRKHLQHSNTVDGKLELDAIYGRINELQTAESGPEVTPVLYSLTADISRLIEQLKRSGV